MEFEKIISRYQKTSPTPKWGEVGTVYSGIILVTIYNAVYYWFIVKMYSDLNDEYILVEPGSLLCCNKNKELIRPDITLRIESKVHRSVCSYPTKVALEAYLNIKFGI